MILIQEGNLKMQIGIDLVEHKDIINKDERFIQRVLSEQEYIYFCSIQNKKRKIEYVASRFACKEAIFKCYKSSSSGCNFSDISILNKENGAPFVLIHNKKVELQISLSHTDNYSIAVAILPLNDDD